MMNFGVMNFEVMSFVAMYYSEISEFAMLEKLNLMLSEKLLSI